MKCFEFRRVIRTDDSGSRPGKERTHRSACDGDHFVNASQSTYSRITTQTVKPSTIEEFRETRTEEPHIPILHSTSTSAPTSSERGQSEAFEYTYHHGRSQIETERRHELRAASRRGRRARRARAAPNRAHASACASAARDVRRARGALRRQQVGCCARRRRTAPAAHALAPRRSMPARARPRAAPKAAPQRGVNVKTLSLVSAARALRLALAPRRGARASCAKFLFDDARAAGLSRPAAEQIPALGIIL